MDTGLAARKVLITGAATGIGRASARAFAAEGAHLALLDINEDELKLTVDSLKGAASVTAVVSDLSTAKPTHR